MRFKILLFFLSSVLFLFSERIMIQNSEGHYFYYDFEELIDISFADAENMILEINLLNGETDDILVSTISNIEFSLIPEARIIVNTTDEVPYEMETININSLSFRELTSADEEYTYNVPATISSVENYPNPFNPETKLRFQLSETGFTKVEIYNTRGEKLTNILGEVLKKGSYEIVWNGKDRSDRPYPSGIYLCRISMKSSQHTHKMLLLK